MISYIVAAVAILSSILLVTLFFVGGIDTGGLVIAIMLAAGGLVLARQRLKIKSSKNNDKDSWKFLESQSTATVLILACISASFVLVNQSIEIFMIALIAGAVLLVIMRRS